MTLQFKLPRRGIGNRPRFWNSKRGNIAIITALMMIPLTFALGMAYDYTMAESRQDQIDGMADVATLAGVTPTQMANSWGTSEAVSANLFLSQIATVNGVVSAAPVWTGSDSSSGATVTRTMTVNYTAASQNVFATLLGMPTFPLKGASTATSSTAPNIDFYLMMDTSPSMEIAATTTGIATMIANTQQESDSSSTTDTWPNPPGIYATGGKFSSAPNGNGCAFGCHQSSPADLTASSGCVSHVDPSAPVTHPPTMTTACQFLTGTTSDGSTPTTPYQKIPCTVAGDYADGTPFTTASTFPESGRDNYDLSRCLGVTLRIDLLNTAAQNLMTTAAATAVTDHATYRMAIYETSSNTESNPLTLYKLQALTSNLTTAKNAAATLVSLEMCNNNHYACGDGNNDEDTDLDDDLVAMNTSGNANYIPNPGNGTNNVGDTPQEVLFIVTDAQNDYNRPNYLPMDWSQAKCTAIRNRGIRIAVLYTTYTPLEESWYQSAVEPSLGSVGGFNNTAPPTVDVLANAAQTCATPGLFYQVSTDGDISAALTHLFQEAIASARLLH